MTKLHTTQHTTGHPPLQKLISSSIALALVSSLCLLTPLEAFADVRKTDLVYGLSVDSRGLSAAECPSIDAERSIVVGSDGTVYFERNADDACQIASITKVMTAVVAMDAVNEGLVQLSDELTVSSEAALVGESSAGLAEGDTMTLETALRALLVPSGNDAAIVIAQHVGAALSGSSDSATCEQAFIAQMNTKAQSIGCTNTVYENPHGLDFDEYEGDLHSTARDQAKVIACAMSFDLIRQIVGGGSTTIQVNRGGVSTDLYLETTDGFLDIYDYAIGVKTGYTQLAGSSFSAAANNGEIELYALVLGSSDDTQRFYDAETLMEWTYEHIVDFTFANSTQSTEFNGSSVPVVAEVAHKGWIDKTVKVTLSDPDASTKVFDLNGNITQSYDFKEPEGNVSAGDVLGTVYFKQRNDVIATYDLIACEDVAAPNFFEGVSIWWQRFFAQFTGAQTQAESDVINTVELVVDKTQN